LNVERIDPAQAREHMEMVDRILAEAQPRLCSGGEYFVVWGIAVAAITVVSHLVSEGRAPAAALWLIPLVLLICALFSVFRARSTRRALARSSLVQRKFFNVLWLALALAFIVDVAVFRIFPGIAGAAIWSVAEAIVLLYIGMHGNRRAQVTGVLIVVSLVVANFVSQNISAYVLAAGMLVGYSGFGASELLARD
jgi:hypothetical protein